MNRVGAMVRGQRQVSAKISNMLELGNFLLLAQPFKTFFTHFRLQPLQATCSRLQMRGAFVSPLKGKPRYCAEAGEDVVAIPHAISSLNNAVQPCDASRDVPRTNWLDRRLVQQKIFVKSKLAFCLLLSSGHRCRIGGVSACPNGAVVQWAQRRRICGLLTLLLLPFGVPSHPYCEHLISTDDASLEFIW